MTVIHSRAWHVDRKPITVTRYGVPITAAQFAEYSVRGAHYRGMDGVYREIG